MSSVAIIGAGPSGLVTGKTALECGLEPTIFEQGATIGGGWRKPDGFAWDGMQTNISYHSCMFSGLEWKSGTPDFPSQEDVSNYLNEYANTFKIHPYVRLNSEVQKIRQANGKWTVEWVNNGIVHNKTFDYVIVCSGIFSKAHKPAIPGLETFPGTVLHSKDYKNPDPFAGRSVAVIGNAFSGNEIASSIGNVTNVIHVFRRAMWIVPRYLQKSRESEKKIPADLLYYSRASHMRSKGVEPKVKNAGTHGWFQSMCNQGKVSPALEVKIPPSAPQFAAISDSYLDQVQKERIQIKNGSIQKIEGDTLIFEDGSHVKADALVCCTGYKTALPFFDQGILDSLGFDPDDSFEPVLLHKTVFPPSSLAGLAFVGLYRGPFFGVIELHALLACMAFSHKIPLPTQEDIEQGIKQELEIRKADPRPQFPHSDYVGMCEDLAAQIGALPDYARLEKENPILYKQIWGGPFTPASYWLGSNPEFATKMITQINKAADV